MSQSDVLRDHHVQVDRDTLRLTLPMRRAVFRFWLLVVVVNVVIPAVVLGVMQFPKPHIFMMAPITCLVGAFFAFRAWKNTTVFSFTGDTFTAIYGPVPPQTTNLTMPIARIVSFDAEYGEDHEKGFILKVLDTNGARVAVPARLHGVVLSMRGSRKQLTGKPKEAFVIALAKELNRLLAESRERQRSFRQ